MSIVTQRQTTLRSTSTAHFQKKRFVILAAQFHPSMTRALVRGAVQTLLQHGVARRDIQLLEVPGAFELPVVAARVAMGPRHPHAVIAVGTLIRGQTPQYEILAHAVAQGLSHVAVNAKIPVTFGVVVATTSAQARARAGGSRGNRGSEAALAALAVLRLFERMA